MFKKAYRYDDNILFYFDHQDSKYVAEGGSIAWRANNPGLLSSRNSHVYKPIGNHHDVAVFSSVKDGMGAFRTWLYLPKFRNSLAEIAKFYKPEAPELYIKTLCEITQFSKDIDFKTISNEKFEIFIKGIQHLNEFSNEYYGDLRILPKISARYYSSDGKVELFVTGYEEIINKEEALRRTESHRLDAVVVHKANGTIYLRSRPGHHLERIHFSQAELQKQPEFKETIRDDGDHKPGQCIWGFINGIDNTPSDAKKAIHSISKFANGECVWSLCNDKKLMLSLGNLWDACLQKMNIETEVAKFAVLFLRFLLKLAGDDPSHPPVIVFAHSQGAIICNVALHFLTNEEKQNLRVFTFGAGSFIFPENAHSETHNYISIGDAVPRVAANSSLALLALRKYEENQQGLTDDEVLEGLIRDDIDKNLTTTDTEAISLARAQYRNYYLSEFNRINHITVLNDERQGIWEHSIHVPCYLKKIQEKILFYKALQESKKVLISESVCV